MVDNCFNDAARFAALALAIWSRSAEDDFLGVVLCSSTAPDDKILVAFDVLDVIDAASDELVENAVVLLFGTNPNLSKSADSSNVCDDGLRKSPCTEARGFDCRTENVLLPDLMFAAGFTGLGDLLRIEEPKLEGGILDVSDP